MKDYIKLTPTVVRRDQLQASISTTPGWNTENDGLMHIRGVDDGTLYRRERSADSGPRGRIICRLVQHRRHYFNGCHHREYSCRVRRPFGRSGGHPAKVRLRFRLNGTLALGGGSFDSRDISTTVGGGTDKWGLFFAGSGHQSDRFLDPVDPRNFNNMGGDVSLDLRSRLACH